MNKGKTLPNKRLQPTAFGAGMRGESCQSRRRLNRVPLGGLLTVSSVTQDGDIIAEFEMVSSSADELLLDDSGTRSFISLCQSEQKITLAAIDDLLTTQPYEQMLYVMKPEFGFGREQFALVMAAALNPIRFS